MKKEQLEIFATAKVCMDTYKNRYDKAKAKKEERFKSLNRNFVPGSPMFVAERDRITPEFEAEVEGARDELSGTFEDVWMNFQGRLRTFICAPWRVRKRRLRL